MITPREVQTATDVAAHYDELDRWYRELWGEHVHHGLWIGGASTPDAATAALCDRLADAIGVQPGHRVCDIGCGYGGTSRVLAYDYGAQVVALTLSRRQWDYARGHAVRPGNPDFLLLDFFQNAFPDGRFDSAFSIESSEHMADKPAFFREMHRIVRRGGRVAVYAWLAQDRPAPWKVRHLLEPICREGRLPGMGDEGEYRQWLEEAGFRDIEFVDYTRQVKRTWPIIIGRMARRLLWDGAAWAFLLGGPQNRVFAITCLRMWIAYETGALRYGLFTAAKPEL